MALKPKIIVQSRIRDLKPWHLVFVLIALIPVLWAIVLSVTAHYKGTVGFNFIIERDALIAVQSFSGVDKGDRIKELWGISHEKVFTYLLQKRAGGEQPFTITIEENNQLFSTHVVPNKLGWSTILKKAWGHYFLIAALVACSLIALLFSPSEQPTGPFFTAFISSAIINANSLTYHFGFSSPNLLSLTYLTILIANWLMFSSWAHFSLNFPVGHQLLVNRPWAVAALYILPPIVTLSAASAAAGSAAEFWFWIHRLRRLFVPLVIIGSYIKIVYDFRTTDSPIVRNQLKYPLFSTPIGLGPYLFLFVIPIIFFNRPLISYSWVVLTAPVFPVAFLMAMIQYRMLDLDENVSRSMAHVILVGVFYSIYAGILYLPGNVIWFQQSSWLMLLFILAVGFFFSPITERIKAIIDRLFFRDKIDLTKLLQKLSRKIALSIQLSDLADVVTHTLPKAFRVHRTCLVVINKDGKQVFPESSPCGKLVWPPRAVLKELRKRNKPLICQGQYPDPLLMRELEALELCGCNLVMGLKSGQRLLGLICVGPKRDNRLFSSKELHVIGSLANQLAVALENAQQYEELRANSEQMKHIYEKLVRSENLASIGEITSLLAHEIKTPLAVISSSAQHLESCPENEDLQKELLEYIISEIDAMDSLVNRMLGLASYKVPRFSTFDITDKLNKLLDRWEHGRDHNQNITIERKYEKSPVALTGDSGQLNQVILNLVRNSEDAMPNGGTISIDIVRSHNNEGISIIIKDTGYGIAQKDKSKIFKKFFSTKQKGLGLGLVLCKQIAQAHNGSITLENLKNKGAEAIVKLPLYPLAGKASRRFSDENYFGENGRKIEN